MATVMIKPDPDGHEVLAAFNIERAFTGFMSGIEYPAEIIVDVWRDGAGVRKLTTLTPEVVKGLKEVVAAAEAALKEQS